MNRSNKPGSLSDAVQRFQEWKESLKLNIDILKSAVDRCFRLALKGKSSGLIIPSDDSFSTADQFLSNLQYKLTIDEYTPGDIIFTNGGRIKIFIAKDQFMVHNMLGNEAKIIFAKDGDNRAKIAKKVLDF